MTTEGITYLLVDGVSITKHKVSSYKTSNECICASLHTTIHSLLYEQKGLI